MKGFIRKGVVISTTLSLLLSGCGINVAELTEEEENIIVSYASGAVAKANRYQLQGLTYPVQEEEPVLEEETPTGEQQEPETQEENQQTDQSQEPEAGNTEQEDTKVGSVTLTEALNVEGLSAEYVSYQIGDTYMVGDYFALTASAGKTYLVLNINLTNTQEQPLECNLFARGLESTLYLNGEQISNAITTILLNDFQSYIKTLEAGAGEETVMIFEVPKEAASDVQTLFIEMTVDGIPYHIELE